MTVAGLPLPHDQPQGEHADEGEREGDQGDRSGEETIVKDGVAQGHQGSDDEDRLDDVEDFLVGTPRVSDSVGAGPETDDQLQDDGRHRDERELAPTGRLVEGLVTQRGGQHERTHPHEGVDTGPRQAKWVL